MNRVTIRRFDVVRTANVVALLYAVAVVVFLLLFLPFVLIAGVSTVGREGAGVMGAGIVGILFLAVLGAVFYGVIGWVMTAIVCALYNAIAGRVGGIRVEVDVEGSWPGGGPGYGAVPPGYQPGYGASPLGYPGQPGAPGGWGDAPPPAPPANWGRPQG